MMHCTWDPEGLANGMSHNGGPSGSLRYLDAPIVLCMGKRGSGPKLLTMHFPFPACEKIIWLFFVHFLPEIQMLRLAGSPYSTGSILLFGIPAFFKTLA